MKNENFIVPFSLFLNTSEQLKIDYLKTFFSQYTQNIFIVGGFLRNQILSLQSGDIDLEVYDIEVALFEELMEKLGATTLSKDFFVYNFDEIDISLPRLESKSGKGYHGFKMEYTNNPQEAVKRRDFTCNALMYNIFDNKLYDYCNGFSDIEDKVLRIVNYESFSEDNFRFLRAVRLLAKFGFTIEEKSKKILHKMNLDDITKTKIEKELKKLFI